MRINTYLQMIIITQNNLEMKKLKIAAYKKKKYKLRRKEIEKLNP